MSKTWLATALGMMLGVSAQLAPAGPIVLAEYRADLDPLVPPLMSRWAAEAYAPELTGQEHRGSLRHPLSFGPHSLTAVLDYEYRQAQWVHPFGQFRKLLFGPQLSFTAGSTTRLYYGFAVDDLTLDTLRDGAAGDAESLRTGLAQTWYFSQRDAELRVGYEYAQGRSDDLYDEMRGHAINVRGRFPLVWGLSADVAAGYSRHNYPEYAGLFDRQSDRLNLRAGISRTFSGQLSGNLNFIYADEDFDDAPLSYRRQAWGLNFKYRY